MSNHPHRLTPHTVTGAQPVAHGQSTPAPHVEAVDELRVGERPAYTGPTLPVAVEGIVPVLVVPAQSWQPQQVPVPSAGVAGTPPATIAGRQNTRRRLLVANVGEALVYLSPRADVSQTAGFPLAPAGGLADVVGAIADAAGASNTFLTLPVGAGIDGLDIFFAAGIAANALCKVTVERTQLASVIPYDVVVTPNGASLSIRFPRTLWADMATAQQTVLVQVPAIASGPAYTMAVYGRRGGNNLPTGAPSVIEFTGRGELYAIADGQGGLVATLAEFAD